MEKLELTQRFLRFDVVIEKVAAIIVTFQPDLGVLQRVIHAITPQVSEVIVVDNSNQKRFIPQDGSLHFLSMGSNQGIAKAQNSGIKLAQQLKATHVLLLDQDSEPSPGMVSELLVSLNNVSNPACVGPSYLDARQQNPPPFIRVEGLKLVRCQCEQLDSVVPVDYLIASGSLIPMTVLGAVGLMREDLFIDYVDIEWGLRAKQRGFQSFGVCAAKMRHSLGDTPIVKFRRAFPVHSPLRHYYHFRNAVYLYRQSWVPLNWKLVDGWRLFLKYGFYTIFAVPRLNHWRMMTIGLWDGLRGRMGEFR